ncbi:MAG: HNH endonuclease [Pseudomonadales bacterium]|nr:HNH endonuclease [Pseudomonadales bacterium]
MHEKSRSKRGHPLKKPRTHAFKAQGGKCYYCNQPMWMKSEQELTSRYSITAKQAKLLQCTGEHLVAHSEGGSSNQMNIAAACLYCNMNRHRGKKSFTPDRFQQLARRRLSKGAWHGLKLIH